MALSYEDLARHFAVKQPKRLRELLRARGIRWLPDRKGRPTTSDAELDRAISAARRDSGADLLLGRLCAPPRVIVALATILSPLSMAAGYQCFEHCRGAR